MKYKLTDNAIVHNGITLYQIQALTSFGDVKEGNLGGYLESESNLSQEGNCWVYGNAKVLDDARIFGNAQVFGNAVVFENARIFDNALICDNARAFGNSKIYGYAEVYGYAKVFDNTRVLDNAVVFENAEVFENAVVFEDAVICGNAVVCGDDVISGITRVSIPPIHLTRLPYEVTITDSHIRIGCKQYTLEEWKSFDDDSIDKMEPGKALAFWKEYKEYIFKLSKNHMTFKRERVFNEK